MRIRQRSKRHIEATTHVRAPLEFVFAQVSDHENMVHWLGYETAKLVEPGEPRNGLGAVREVYHDRITVRERVVYWDPPRRYDYTIIRGLPIEHLGSFELEPSGEGVRVRWRVEISSRIPLLARGLSVALGRGMPQGLARFVTYTEGLAARSPDLGTSAGRTS